MIPTPTLQKLIIRNPFSDSPTITNKINRWWLGLKSILVGVCVASLAGGGFYLNLQYEQRILLEQRFQEGKVAASEGGVGVVLDATADIIVRDGNVPVPVARKYATWIYDASVKHNVDPMLILSVMFVESRFNYLAISPTGPIGLLQIAASWHKEKVTRAALFDPKINIDVGAQILREYGDRSSTDAETLLRYNGSLGAAPVYAVKVLSVRKKYSGEIMEAVAQSI